MKNSNKKSGKVYWAGDLFDYKDLLGNRILADAFNRQAAGRWVASLPQESEVNTKRTASIRDDDLENLFSASALVANFDGHDLDSGTVVEFCFAKFLDLPAVLLRTDFRFCGDRATCPDPWNLMCSGYPRTEVVLYNAMVHSASGDFSALSNNIASQVLEALDRAASQAPVYPDEESRMTAFINALRVAGGSLAQRFPEERIRDIIASLNP